MFSKYLQYNPLFVIFFISKNVIECKLEKKYFKISIYLTASVKAESAYEAVTLTCRIRIQALEKLEAATL